MPIFQMMIYQHDYLKNLEINDYDTYQHRMQSRYVDGEQQNYVVPEGWNPVLDSINKEFGMW